MSLSKNHKKLLKRLVLYYKFDDNDSDILSHYEIEFLWRRIRRKI